MLLPSLLGAPPVSSWHWLAGFLAGAVNGAGNVVKHTTNGGLNWTNVPGDFNKALLLLDLEVADETIIVAGGEFLQELPLPIWLFHWLCYWPCYCLCYWVLILNC